MFYQGLVPCPLALLWPPHLQGLRVSQTHHALLLVGSYGSSTYPRQTVALETFRVMCLGRGCSIGHGISRGLRLHVAGRQSEETIDHVHWTDLQHNFFIKMQSYCHIKHVLQIYYMNNNHNLYIISSMLRTVIHFNLLRTRGYQCETLKTYYYYKCTPGDTTDSKYSGH